MFIFVAVLPVLMFMAGCGGGYAEERYNPNEQHIYVHHVDDDYNPWVNAFKPMTDFSKSTQQTMRDEQRDVRQMNRDNRDALNILKGAR